MMECESYNLNWEEFDAYTSLTFKQLLSKPDFTDVTLACEGEETIEAHKVILSACSPFFDRILKKNSHTHPLIFLTDVTHSDLKSIINFMYLGQTNVVQEDLQRFLKVATKFQVRGLTDGKKKGSVVQNTAISIEDEEAIHPEEENLVQEQDGIVNAQSSLDNVVMLEDENRVDDFDYKCDLGNSSGFYHGSTEEHNDINSSLLMDGFRMVPEKVFPCDQCDYKASYSCNLNSHKRTVHEKLFFQCHLCAYKSSRKDRLNKHVLSKHSSVL